MANLRLVPKDNLSSFRRIALGTWRTVGDPTVYGSLSLKMDDAMAYLEEFRRRTGKRLTLTHMMAKAVSHVMHEVPDANAILRLGRIYLRQDVGVFFQVMMKDPDTGELDLSGATVFDAHNKGLEQIVDEFEAHVQKVRARKDKALESTRSTFKRIPYSLLRFALNAIGFLSYTLNLDMRWAGIPKDPFGSAMVTNIGSLGLEEAYVPLVPYSRVPLLVAMGEVKQEPVVMDGKVGIGRIMRLYATFDHRVLDGAHAAKMTKILRRFFEEPVASFGALPEAAAPAPAQDTAVAPPA